MPFQLELGKDVTLSINNTEVKVAREVTININSVEVDATTRDCGGFKRSAVALVDLSISVSAFHDSTLASLLINSLKQNSPLDVSFSSPTGVGYTGKWICTSISFGQPVNDAVTIDFTLKPTYDRPSS